ncbi:hypothetical protein RchiOBHm_Chr5g0067801 [Rosa chinensis]|uniref:DUF674 family protein n=1 Tax=Rosa chinensis TaxID=74649 RepID=A0A2P6QJK4_ROSCH|nr:hypothetical protein RchiOBHm_Chr5g0067801 [Rosa chinensis]
MAQEVSDAKNISLKALVDKGRNRVIFVEADNDFIDVLFSFLTLPMGKIVRLARDHSIALEIGCMNKLYQSIEKLDVQVFKSNACRDMLLLPHSAANCHCKNLKLKIIDDAEPQRFDCSATYSHPPGSGDSQDGGVFVKERARVIITDDLQVIFPLSAASISLFTKLGATNSNTTEELTFSIGVEQVLNLIVSSFVSKTPLTETLLKPNPVPKLGCVNFSQGKCIESQMSAGASIDEETEKISVKLIVSKSKNLVCYAEVREDFVNLIFSFLTLPLGFILKQMLDSPWKGCIDQLCKGVLDFDEQFFKSNYHKELLCNSKLVPGFSYENNLLGIEEAVYYKLSNRTYTADTSIISSASLEAPKVQFLDPKSHGDKDRNARGFLKEPAIFTVTDNLDVRPVSPIFQLSVLNYLKVHFTDIEYRTVHVGKNEALRLLVASVVSDSLLTNAFLRKPKEPLVKQEQ